MDRHQEIFDVGPDAVVSLTNMSIRIHVIKPYVKQHHRVWVSCHAADYKPVYVVVNAAMFLVVIIPKIPEMHRVRLFGINATPGFDVKVEYSPKKEK